MTNTFSMNMFVNMTTTPFGFAFNGSGNIFKGKNEYIELIADGLKAFANDKMSINITQLSTALGISRETATSLVVDLKYLPNGREKLYLLRDVAEKIYSRMCCDSVKGNLYE